jgi:hypothetical protein
VKVLDLDHQALTTCLHGLDEASYTGVAASGFFKASHTGLPIPAFRD